MKTKPKKFAPWLDTPSGYKYKMDQAAKKAEKVIAKANKHYEQVVDSYIRRKSAKRAKRVSPVSRKRTSDLKAYAALRKFFLAGYNSEVRCRCCAVNPATDVHHTRGRAGKLLLDVRYWLPLCRSCHRWVGENPEAARRLGLLCQKGEWGKV